MAHLRTLRATTATHAGRPLAAHRLLTEAYALADASCTTLVGPVRPVDVDGVPGEWHVPDGADPARRMLYLHGGGWIAGSLGSHRALVGRLAAAFGGVTLAIDYRLAPEHAFPAGLDDCVHAARWLRDHGPARPSTATQLVVAGDSAGGNLALATLLTLRDAGDPLPDAAALLSPVTDLAAPLESRHTRAAADPVIPTDGLDRAVTAYVQGRAEPDDPLVAPLRADLTGLPRLLVEVGDAEVLLSDSTDFADAARAAGVDVELVVTPAMPHIFPIFAPFLPEATAAVERIGTFLRG